MEDLITQSAIDFCIKNGMRVIHSTCVIVN